LCAEVNVVSDSKTASRLVELDTGKPVWERCFMVAPLVLVGTRDEDGALDLAPKHMAFPLGWRNYFGFVCCARHKTQANIQRTGEFTVSYAKPSQVVHASLAATPRLEDGSKDVLASYPTFAAQKIDGEFIENAYLFLECKLFKIVDGFGENCLITGEIVAAYADPDYIRSAELDDQELIHGAPLLAYLPPGRFATISRSNSFPFPDRMKR
jgi:flavin reductase (DIM6/NTAB) family NADH-FMN oxidoreductase RutF